MLWEHVPQASVSIAFSSSPKLSRVFVVVYHLHEETGWSMVCANGKQNSHIGNFRLGWRVSFEQQTQLTERA